MMIVLANPILDPASPIHASANPILDLASPTLAAIWMMSDKRNYSS
jgi:hypothetical protein